MRIATLLMLSIFIIGAACQRRRNNHQRGGGRNFQNHGPRPFRQPPFPREFRPQVINAHEQLIANTNCPHIQLTRRTNDRIYGNFVFDSASDLEEMNIDVEFDRAVVGFVNNLANSMSSDNRIFTVNDLMGNQKRGEDVSVEFHVNFHQDFPPPVVTKLKLNGQQICPADDSQFNRQCADVAMITDATEGRYDAVLTVYPNQIFNGARKIDLEFDEKSWAVGNDLGESVTKDQMHYTIFNSRPINSNKPLVINFFVKFDVFEDIPKLKSLSVDDVPVCLPATKNAGNIKRSNVYSTLPPPPTFNRSEGSMLLTDLPFDSFPSVTNSPQQVFNNDFECGLTGNVIASRVNDGVTAHHGQFPFHAAVFFDARYRCGGSLISEKALVSASHCVVDSSQRTLPVDEFHLFFGSIDLQWLSGHEALRNVSQIIRHPNYQHDKILKQDIAVLMIKGKLQFSQYIRPICLPDALQPIAASIDRELIVVGFGSSTESLKLSRFLHHGKMTVISREQCTENSLILALLPEQTTFCAIAKENTLACPGDSGGGIVEMVDGKLYLRGIASVTLTEANGRCNVENPVGFTDVKAFLGWLKDSV